MRSMRISRWIIAIFIVVTLLFALAYFARKYPQNMPWTALDLNEPVGWFTGRKLTRLTIDTAFCQNLLEQADIRFEPMPEVQAGQHCSYDNGTRFPAEGGTRSITYEPASVTLSCPVAATLAVWERNTVQPAARDVLGQPIVRIAHYGGYNCRTINGAADGQWSEHATANAIDVAAFILADGTRISVVDGWNGPASHAAFLRRARDGACDLFANVLSPDYNAAHADHFHLDQAERGAYGRRVCR